jgi:hypothetical protein
MLSLFPWKVRQEPIELPKEVDPESNKFDDGFLESIYSQLVFGEKIEDYDRNSFLNNFENAHDRLMSYSNRHDNGWFPDNYAFEDISWIHECEDFFGKMYRVTGWDGSQINGRIKPVLRKNREGSNLIKVHLNDRTKGFVLIPPNSGSFHTTLYIGSNDLEKGLKMPRYSERGCGVRDSKS